MLLPEFELSPTRKLDEKKIHDNQVGSRHCILQYDYETKKTFLFTQTQSLGLGKNYPSVTVNDKTVKVVNRIN